MIDMLNDLEKHSEMALMKIEEYLRTHNDFSCSRQIDDMKNLLESVESIEKLKAMPSIK